jgi:hypothetical protein
MVTYVGLSTPVQASSRDASWCTKCARMTERITAPESNPHQGAWAPSSSVQISIVLNAASAMRSMRPKLYQSSSSGKFVLPEVPHCLRYFRLL